MNPITLLVVDDHAVVREGIEAMISLEPDLRVVGSAVTGAQAIELHRTVSPDVTLMDLGLPDMDGALAIAAVRRESPNARFLVLSALHRDQDVARALRAGAQGYLFKSSASAELLSAIRTIAGGARYFPPDVTSRALDALGTRDLTQRELTILNRVAAGDSNGAIAQSLHIDVGTVKTHVHNILDKLGATSRTHAVAVAIRRGLVSPPGD